ncbi:pro-sigmaK processing inhibitor BofA family protein [Clostridium thermarum]|uniref:pro-sigmaK processing inhibitor BofA family protein n=1 Tax=Clostridium thermarum TaxID=1716543 RepID=UPI00111EA0E8|nr:pro-sigmaK processing inhibitor BofA family protein [Clostridium thermarum]
MEYAAYFLVVVIILFLIARSFSGSWKPFRTLLLNCLLGLLLLVVVNFIGSYLDFFIGINAVTVLVSGLCGIPGLAFLVILKLFL